MVNSCAWQTLTITLIKKRRHFSLEVMKTGTCSLKIDMNDRAFSIQQKSHHHHCCGARIVPVDNNYRRMIVKFFFIKWLTIIVVLLVSP